MMNKMIGKMARSLIGKHFDRFYKEIYSAETGEEALDMLMHFFKEVDEKLKAFGEFSFDAIGLPDPEEYIQKVDNVRKVESKRDEWKHMRAIEILVEYKGRIEG